MVGRQKTSSLKGKIAATLIGIACTQRSDGEVNFASPFVDDEGIDLIFFKRGGVGKVILAQVKSRSTDSKLLSEGTFRVQVRRASFKPREGYYLIFVALDEPSRGLANALWFIPSMDFQKKLVRQTNRDVLVFQSKFDSDDMWKSYRMSLDSLSSQVSRLLDPRAAQ